MSIRDPGPGRVARQRDQVHAAVVVFIAGGDGEAGRRGVETVKRPTGILTCMKTRCILAGVALICAMLIAGCVGISQPGGGTGSDTQTIAPRASAAPTLPAPAPGGNVGSSAVLIVDPPFDGGVSSGTVTVSVEVTGFVLIPSGGPNRQGTGHLVYYRDVPPKIVHGETALTAPGTCAVSSETAYTWNGIAPGTHTFSVQLVNADDTPLDSPAIDAVDVTAVSSGMISAP